MPQKVDNKRQLLSELLPEENGGGGMSRAAKKRAKKRQKKTQNENNPVMPEKANDKDDKMEKRKKKEGGSKLPIEGDTGSDMETIRKPADFDIASDEGGKDDEIALEKTKKQVDAKKRKKKIKGSDHGRDELENDNGEELDAEIEALLSSLTPAEILFDSSHEKQDNPDESNLSE
eukprot:3627104-Ditylum_brightwellii.AAC.1